MIGETNQGYIQSGQLIKLRTKKGMKIVLEDTEMGIKKSDLNKLFKHFGKLKDKKKLNTKGTCLGLNISKKIVESMGGKMSVESEYKKRYKIYDDSKYLNKKPTITWLIIAINPWRYL